uniref:Uncharacterized protein n=1 Tax=Panagrolaimus superbus TaxID=310955 RepID=A0A914XZV8_9BILA
MIFKVYFVYVDWDRKKVIVYRFVTEETMEKVIYNRQLTKEATQGRVLDDLNYENKFTKEQLANLYPSTGIYENTEKDPENLSERDPFLLSIIKGHPGAIQEIRSHPSYFNEDDELEDETFEDDDSDFETFAL